MKKNNTIPVPTRTILQALIPKVMGRLVDHTPGKFIEFDTLLNAVMVELGVDPANPPYRLRGEQPNLRRNCYVSAWNLAVERRGGFFWLVRIDPDSLTEVCVSESSGGKGRAGATARKSKGWLWGMTWYGIMRSLEMNGVTATNLTSLWMERNYDVRQRNSAVAAVSKRCPLSVTMNLQEEHAHEHAVKLLERDGLKNQLIAHRGYGRKIRPSEMGAWAIRDAFSQMRGWGTDAHLRTLRGATTETERKRAAKQGDETISVGYQKGVSPIVIDTSEEDGLVVADFADQTSLSPEDEEEAKDIFMHYEILIERKLRYKKPERYITTMYMLYADHSQREIATELGVSSTTVSGMIRTLKELLAADQATQNTVQ